MRAQARSSRKPRALQPSSSQPSSLLRATSKGTRPAFARAHGMHKAEGMAAWPPGPPHAAAAPAWPAHPPSCILPPRVSLHAGPNQTRTWRRDLPCESISRARAPMALVVSPANSATDFCNKAKTVTDASVRALRRGATPTHRGLPLVGGAQVVRVAPCERGPRSLSKLTRCSGMLRLRHLDIVELS
jgi:hypothetical protein